MVFNCVESVNSLCFIDREDSLSGIHTGFFYLFFLSYIIKFHIFLTHRKSQFARNECVRPFAPEMEHVCGRPLGLRFDKKTGNLYIADAYLGLQVVGPTGGLATPVVTELEGQPMRFTNDLDIDEQEDVIYFTDTSMVFQRRYFKHRRACICFYSQGMNVVIFNSFLLWRWG